MCMVQTGRSFAGWHSVGRGVVAKALKAFRSTGGKAKSKAANTGSSDLE